jgi:hypothetical protein
VCCGVRRGLGGNFWFGILRRTEGFVVGFVLFCFVLALVCGKGGEGKRIGS